MNPLNAFPFKNMKKIVELLEEDEVSVRQISRATGMCSRDSTEVSNMLAYLTNFGRVEQTKSGWMIHRFGEGAKYGKFRQRFLESAEVILHQLSSTPKPVEQIANEIKISVNAVEMYLQFLTDITRLGVISQHSRMFRKSWRVVSSQS